MKVIDIVADYLKTNGYDGLFNGNSECACEIDDLCPCDALSEDCAAGYRYPCTCGDHDFHIGTAEAREQWNQENALEAALEEAGR